MPAYTDLGFFPTATWIKSNIKTKPEKKKMATKDTLYEIRQGGLDGDKVLYGYKAGVNRAGKWLMEIKGEGTIIAVDKYQLEEVLPYTVGISFGKTSMVYHYFDDERLVEAGDILVMDNLIDGKYQLGRVVATDTKSSGATKHLSFYKKV